MTSGPGRIKFLLQFWVLSSPSSSWLFTSFKSTQVTEVFSKVTSETLATKLKSCFNTFPLSIQRGLPLLDTSSFRSIPLIPGQVFTGSSHFLFCPFLTCFILFFSPLQVSKWGHISQLSFGLSFINIYQFLVSTFTPLAATFLFQTLINFWSVVEISKLLIHISNRCPTGSWNFASCLYQLVLILL